MSTENQTELEQVRAEQHALKIRVLAESLERLALAAQNALEQAEGLSLATEEIAVIGAAVSAAQTALRREVGGVPANLLKRGDVIANPQDSGDLLVVVEMIHRRNGSTFVGAGDKDGNRHSLIFAPDEIVYVFEPRV